MSREEYKINPHINPENPDTNLDRSLRPDLWEEYIGQKTVKDNLQILLQAATQRNQQPEHLLFYGPPGLGKTTLAYLIAKELKAQVKVTSGPAIDKVGDLASILTNLNKGDILFVDEVHRLNKMVEEVLYPAMESGSLHIVLGKGAGARVMQLDLPPFTLVAATTRIALLSSPLRSRFSGGVFKLNYYTQEEIVKIIDRSAGLLNIQIERDAAAVIAQRSRYTPRIANHLLKRCRDFAQVNKRPLDRQLAEETLTLLGIDSAGLTHADRQVLSVLIDKFNGRPTGLNTLATALGEEEATILEVYEPYLIQLGFLERTKQGRLATEKGYTHLGISMPTS